MTINDGYTKSSAFLQIAQDTMICQPCTEQDNLNVAFRTSQVIEDPTTKLQHIVPIDDDEELFDPINPQQLSNIQVDESTHQ